MKKYIFPLLFFLSISCVDSFGEVIQNQTVSQNITKNDVSLRTFPKNTFEIHQTSKLLSETIDSLHFKKKKNLVVFIHGRGKQPEKAYKQDILEDMENEYQAKVIMFHWPSWISMLSRPILNAHESSIFLADFFKEMEKFIRENPEKWKSLNVTLMMHSMGNILFEDVVKQKLFSSNQTLFNSLILSSSDIDAKNHHKWLSKVQFAKKTYVISNPKDVVLKSVEKLLKKSRLGVRQTDFDGNPVPKLKNVTYISLDHEMGYHRYYIGRIRTEETKKIFSSIINNQFLDQK
jgi:esterase/lipase superfamily enzyme